MSYLQVDDYYNHIGGCDDDYDDDDDDDDDSVESDDNGVTNSNYNYNGGSDVAGDGGYSMMVIMR